MAAVRAADDPEGTSDGEEAHGAVYTLLIQTTGSPDPHHLTVGHMGMNDPSLSFPSFVSFGPHFVPPPPPSLSWGWDSAHPAP